MRSYLTGIRGQISFMEYCRDMLVFRIYDQRLDEVINYAILRERRNIKDSCRGVSGNGLRYTGLLLTCWCGSIMVSLWIEIAKSLCDPPEHHKLRFIFPFGLS